MPRLLPIPLLAAWLFAGPLLAPAGAVSVEELFHLKANGLSDDILVALIESDGSVFHLTPDEVLALHRKGLGEKVILAMLGTARRARPEPVQPPSPERIVERVVEVPVATSVPPFEQSIVQRVEVSRSEPVYVQVPVAIPVAVAVPVRREKPTKPVYWGFGGTLRPGSWRPARPSDRNDRNQGH